MWFNSQNGDPGIPDIPKHDFYWIECSTSDGRQEAAEIMLSEDEAMKLAEHFKKLGRVKIKILRYICSPYGEIS